MRTSGYVGEAKCGTIHAKREKKSISNLSPIKNLSPDKPKKKLTQIVQNNKDEFKLAVA